MSENFSTTGNGWTVYQKLVLAQLEAHHEALSDMNKTISDLRVEISALKIQAGIWGLGAGMIPVIVALAISLIGRGK